MTGNTAQNIPTIAISKDDIIGFFDGHFRTAMESIPDEMKAMQPEELEAKFDPGPIDYYLRKNLWKQVELARAAGETSLNPIDIYKGICHVSTFHGRVIKNNYRLAWLLINPVTDAERAEESLAFGLMRIRRDLLTLPMNEKTAPTILRAVELLWNRVHGPLIQRIEAKHAHLNLNKPLAKAPVHERLSEFKDKLQPAAIDVTPVLPAKEEP